MADKRPDTPAREIPRASPLPSGALRQLLDATSAIVAAKDLAGRYIYVNQAFLQLMGGREPDFIGRTDLELFDADLAAQLHANDRRVVAEGRELLFEETLVIDGLQRSFKSRKYPLLDAAGLPWAVCLTAEDVTEARRLDEALRRVALGVSAASGPEVFELTVTNLAAVLDVDFVFVAALEEDEQPARLVTLAACERGHAHGLFEYGVAGTPCASVLRHGFQYHSGTAAGMFDADPLLGNSDFTSYAGYPLLDSTRKPSGVLSVCHGGPLPPSSMLESIMAIFAVRAAAELERVRMDSALQASEESYRTIFEATDDCIFIHDFDTGAIVDVNPRVCEVYGYDYHTMLTLGPGDLSTGEPPYTQADAEQYIRRARAGEIIRFEWHRRNADGSMHWDEVCLKHVRLAGVDRILAVTRDITERKERERALARSEDRLRATVAAALDCIIAMDSGGRIREFNPAAESCLGYRREEALGRPLAELIIPPRFRRAHLQGVERYLQGGEPWMVGRRMELTAMRADGSEFPVELAIAEAQGVDGIIFIGYMRDLTLQIEAEQARTRIEQQLRQAQKMEAIGHLAGGVAHDFNNILTGIMGYLGMAEDAAGEGNPRLLRYLERARHSGERATDLIQQMLTFSRGQRGDPRPLAPAPLLRDALRLVRAAMPATLALDVELDTSVPAVMVDPVQIEQVMMNLCINARDAMRGQGTLEIRLRCVDETAAICSSCQQIASGRFVELSVADCGPGIPPEVLTRMFEPFYTTKAPGHGSGMGLATVHGIVHEYSGHVSVACRRRGGARFRVLLPALADPADASAMDPPAQQPPQQPHGTLNGHVLLVEDDPVARSYMTELLEQWGLEVSACGDPLAVPAMLQPGGRRFDAAILDYTMPHMTGLALARLLHLRDPFLPMLLYSGYADGLDESKLADAGILACLAKPVDTAQLLRQLQRLLPRH